MNLIRDSDIRLLEGFQHQHRLWRERTNTQLRFRIRKGVIINPYPSDVKRIAERLASYDLAIEQLQESIDILRMEDLL